MKKGLRQKDAAHVACAIFAKADYFLTTDKKILNKSVKEIELINPIDFIRRYNENE
jgi:predicted nucleic acid-binding protein